jgi:predicted transcriptional regulator
MAVQHTTIRIKKEYRDILKELAEKEALSMQEILEQTIEEYQKKKFFEQLNKAYNELQENDREWEEELKERLLWETTLQDNIEEE